MWYHIGEKVSKLAPAEQEKHLTAIQEALSVPEKGPPSPKLAHLLNYMATVASVPEVANKLTSMGVLSLLARLIKETQHADM